MHCGISPEYFLDEMTAFETEAILNAYMDSKKESWEQTRHIMHVVAQVNSKKTIPLTKVLKFPWDNDPTIESKPSTRADFDAMAAKYAHIK